MGVGEFIRNALDSIWAHKLRSMLTMLGIIIGIASIIAISSTIMGTNEQIKNNLVGAGNNVVTAMLFKGTYELEMDYEQVPEGTPIFDDSILDDLRQIHHVVDATRYYTRSAYNSVYYGATVLSMGTIIGAEQNYLSINGYTIKAGRNFEQSDFDGFRKVALIDGNVSQTLFHGTNPIGETIEVKGEPYIVVGLIEPKDSFMPVIETLSDYQTYMNTSGGMVIVPIVTWPVIYIYDEPCAIGVQTDEVENMTEVGKQLVDCLNSYFSGDSGDVKYKSNDILQKAKDLQALSSSTNQQLVWIASISLLVGGIGVMNIMLVSVKERTKEIGLKKALGAKRKTISRQFLIEAGLLTTFGGILGVIFGILLAFIISKASSAPIAISPLIIVGAVFFSFVVGLFFGAVPASQAAKLNPIDALRGE